MTTPMLTPWGERLLADPQAPVLPEYPRPQLVRGTWLNLNGPWEYAITSADVVAAPTGFDGDIRVPFSPEAPLSGVGRTLLPDQALWYRRRVAVPPAFERLLAAGGRVLLHFGAVDQSCEVSCDGTPVGGHVGGFTPFTLDLTDALTPDPDRRPGAAPGQPRTFELVVRVRDLTDTSHHSRGKQVSKPGGIWYTPQSGIWQTVWLEAVPSSWVQRIDLRPQLDPPRVEVTVRPGPGSTEATARVRLRDGDRVLADHQVPVDTPITLPVPDAVLWTPATPHLYDLDVVLGDDHVRSYTAVRTVGVGPDARGRSRLLLNGEPYLHAGLLDQGYWPDGLLTAPDDEAFVHDIVTARELGFTMLRKHIKLEPLRWYHHCDRLGMLVWQDMVNGGRSYDMAVITTPVAAPQALPLSLDDRRHRLFGRQDAEGRDQFRRELVETLETLAAVPSVVVWVPFNEGWGQFDAHEIARTTRELDPTRVVDHASGWHDQGGGDLVSRHVYFRGYRLSGRDERDPRAAVLSEYGGYSHRVAGHTWSTKEFGYRRIKDRGAFQRAFLRLQQHQVRPALARGLSAFVYTQVSDVEEESNGLMTYDRRVLKVDVPAVAASNAGLRSEFDAAVGREPAPVTVTETELLAPVDLTLPDGRLNPAAVGWSRTPLVRTDGIGRGRLGTGRNKRWEYWCLTTPSHVLAVVLSDIDYAGVNGVWLLDRRTGTTVGQDVVTPLARGVDLPGTLDAGPATLRSRGLQVDLLPEPAGTRIRVTGERIRCDLLATRPERHEALAVVVPWTERLFQYTVKDVARPASGWLAVDGARTEVGPGAWATLDHGRGRWPHRVHWNWGVGSGTVDGSVLGLQVGGRWTDGTGVVENSLTVDGRLHKISQELVWEYSSRDWSAPWRVRGEDLDLYLDPEHVKSAHTDLALLSTASHQCFGTWRGTVLGRRVDGLFGWAEDVRQKW